MENDATVKEASRRSWSEWSGQCAVSLKPAKIAHMSSTVDESVADFLSDLFQYRSFIDFLVGRGYPGLNRIRVMAVCWRKACLAWFSVFEFFGKG